jgi:hypothetical protein
MSFLNLPRRHGLCAFVAALALPFGAPPQAAANDLACPADIFVMNRKGASIKVLKFEYTVRGKTYTEGLDNKRLAPGEEEEWHSVKLQHAAIGNVISSTRVEFKDDNSGAGDGYGPPRWSAPHPHTDSYECIKGRNYAHYIE